MELGQRRDAAAVALDRDDQRSGVQQRSSQAPGPGADFIDALALEAARDRGNARQQLPVEDEVLPKRLARAEAVARDDVP